MKKLFIIIYLISFAFNTPANSNPDLDIGEGSKTLDYNFLCTGSLNNESLFIEKGIVNQKWFGIKFMEKGLPIVFKFNLDEGKYKFPVSTLLNFGKTTDGYDTYVFLYGLFDDNPTIWENMLYLKGEEAKLIYNQYELDKKEEPKIINELETKMSKEPNNTKYVKFLDQLTYEIDKILGTKKPPILKKNLSFTYNCKDSTAILKAS